MWRRMPLSPTVGAFVALVGLVQGFAPSGVAHQGWKNQQRMRTCYRRLSHGSCSPACSGATSSRQTWSAPRRRAGALWRPASTSAETVEGEGGGGVTAEVETTGEEGGGAEEKEQETPKEKKRAGPKRKVPKKKKKPELPPEEPRRTINMVDLAYLEEGLTPVRPMEYPDGWEFVEEGEEYDEEEPAFWAGADPSMDEEGRIRGVAEQAIRTTRRAVLKPDKDEGIKVEADDDFHWYLLRCYATYELRCLSALESMLPVWGLEDSVRELYVPVRPVPRTSGRSFKFLDTPMHPGYIYCHLRMDERMREKVNGMDHIVGFMGKERDEHKKIMPDRMNPKAVMAVKAAEAEMNAKAQPALLEKGALVEITEGPFATKKGEVMKVKEDLYVVKVNTFGRNSDVKVSWSGARQLTELEQENCFEETRRALDATYKDRETDGNRERIPSGGRGRYDRDRGGRGGGSGNDFYEFGRGERQQGGRRGQLDDFGGDRKGLRGFGGWGGDRDEEDAEADLAARRFMEKDLAMFERESKAPSLRRRRPSGEEVDRQLPQKAFESDRDANAFFDELDDILGVNKEGRKLPVLPGARVQGPSIVERAHASATMKTPPPPSSGLWAGRNERIQEKGQMNRAPLESGVSRVSADVWSGDDDTGEIGDLEGLDDIAVSGGGVGDDDDFFTALMQELKESSPASPSKQSQARDAGQGDGGGAAALDTSYSPRSRRSVGDSQRNVDRAYGGSVDADGAWGMGGGRVTNTINSAGAVGQTQPVSRSGAGGGRGISSRSSSSGAGRMGEANDSSGLEELLAELGDVKEADGERGVHGMGGRATVGPPSRGGLEQSSTGSWETKHSEGIDDIFADLGLADLAGDDFASLSIEKQRQHQQQQHRRGQDPTDMERGVAGPGPTRSRPSPSLDADAMIGALLRDDDDVGDGAGRGEDGWDDFHAVNRNAAGLSSGERINDDGIKKEAMPWDDDYSGDSSVSSPGVISSSEKSPPLPESARRSTPTVPGTPTSSQRKPSLGSTVDSKTPNAALPMFSDMDLLLPKGGRRDGHGDGQEWVAEVGRFEGYEDDNDHDSNRRQPQNRSVDRSGNNRSGGDRVEEHYGTISAGRSTDTGRSSTVSAVHDPRAAVELLGDVGDSFDAIDGFFEGNDEHVGGNIGDSEGSHQLADSERSPIDDTARSPAEIASGASSVLVNSGDDAVENGSGGQGRGGAKASAIAGMKVVELKARCKEMGLPVSGKKAELQQRILSALG